MACSHAYLERFLYFIYLMAKTLLSLLIGAALGAGALVAANHYGISLPTTAGAQGGTSRPLAQAVMRASQPQAGENNEKRYVNVAAGSR